MSAGSVTAGAVVGALVGGAISLARRPKRRSAYVRRKDVLSTYAWGFGGALLGGIVGAVATPGASATKT